VLVGEKKSGRPGFSDGLVHLLRAPESTAFAGAAEKVRMVLGNERRLTGNLGTQSRFVARVRERGYEAWLAGIQR